MDGLVYFTRNVVLYMLDALQIAMFLRAIFSWFDPEGEKRFSVFLMTVTEPLIFPIRSLCAKRHWFEQVPLDVPFFITYLLLMVIETVISVI